MEKKYTKYRRVTETFKCLEHDKIQSFLDKLVVDNYEIISYNEDISDKIITVRVLIGELDQRQIL